MSESIRVIIKEPNEKGVIKYVVDDLYTWQKLVGGHIEVVVYDFDLNILVMCNEEGKLIGLNPNIVYYTDILVGTIVFLSGNEEGDFVGLNDEQVLYVMRTLRQGGIG